MIVVYGYYFVVYGYFELNQSSVVMVWCHVIMVKALLIVELVRVSQLL